MGLTVKCIDCGTSNVSEPDHEGMIDCFECGAAFIPGVATTHLVCAECGTTKATTYVVTQLDPKDPTTRTEVCRSCDNALHDNPN